MSIQEYFETHARDELRDVHALAAWANSSGVIMTKSQQVLQPSDLKGLRIRTPSLQLGAMLSAFGAEPKHTAGTDAAAGLDRGELDGALFPYEVIPTFKLQSRIHRISEFAGDRGLFVTIFIFAMNKNAYLRMPPELRKVIDENSGMPLAVELGRLWDEFEWPGRDAFEAAGGLLTFIKGDQYDAWYRQSQPVVEAWVREQKARGVDGDVLLKSARYCREVLSAFNAFASDA